MIERYDWEEYREDSSWDVNEDTRRYAREIPQQPKAGYFVMLHVNLYLHPINIQKKTNYIQTTTK